MNVLNISYTSSAAAQSGGHIRINQYNNGFSSLSNISIKQASFELNIFSRKKFIYHNENYSEFIFFSLFYTFFKAILSRIFHVRRWPIYIPIIFKLIRPNRKLRKMFEWAEIIQVEEIWLVSWISRFTDKPLILVQHNVEYILAEILIKRKRWKKTHLSRLVFKTENEAIHSANIVFCIGEVDKQNMIDLYGCSSDKLKIVPNGILTDRYKQINFDNEFLTNYDSVFRNYKYVALFTGSNYYPNIEAAESIVNIIAPSQREVLFIIAGSVYPDESLNENVFITGRLSDQNLLNTFHLANFAINPVVSGSGSNIKMFEYMAAGLPIVTTECGSRGITDTERDAMVVCSVEDMASQIKELLQSPKKMDKLSQDSLDISINYDFVTIAKNARPYYKSLLNQSC